MQSQSIMPVMEKEISNFVDRLKINSSYDCVIAIERKGLAVFRLLADQVGAEKLGFSNVQILSNEALEYLPGDFCSGKRILVFDDSVYSGTMLKHVVDSVLSSGAVFVESASLLAHMSCSHIPTWVLYPNLTTADYGEFRTDLINYLATSDYLILDSEHTPMKIKTNMSPQEFVETLAKLDRVGIVPSLDSFDQSNRIFVTIDNPRFFDVGQLPLQPGSKIEQTVMKLRVIIYDQSAWLIPLVYPSTPITASQATCPLFKESPEVCICEQHNGTYHQNNRCFHCQALYAGVYLLARTFALLRKVMGHSFEYEKLPLTNLLAVFPEMNIPAFEDWIKNVFDKELETLKLPDYLEDGPFSITSEPDQIVEASDQVLLKLLRHADEAELRRIYRPYQGAIHNSELSVPFSRLVMDALPSQELSYSLAVDSLIDQGLVGAAPVPIGFDEPGHGYWVRGMKSGSEYIRVLLRHALSWR